MMLELFLVLILAVTGINVVLLSMIPNLVKNIIQEELRRLFEGEYQ